MALNTSLLSGARRHRAIDHRLQHLGGGDADCSRLVGLAQHHLLQRGHAADLAFDAEVAAGDHQAVAQLELGDDLVDAGHSLRLLDLGDHADVALQAGDFGLQRGDVSGSAHERQRNVFDMQFFERITQVVQILGCQRGRVDRGAGQVDRLARPQHAAMFHPSANLGPLNRLDTQADLAVVEQDQLALAHLIAEPVVVGRDPLAVARHVLGGDRETLAVLEEDGAACELSGADLGTLKVRQHGQRAAETLRDLSRGLAAGAVLLV